MGKRQKSKSIKYKHSIQAQKRVQRTPSQDTGAGSVDSYHVDGPEAGGEPGPSSNELAEEATDLLSQLSPSVSPNSQKNALQMLISKISSPFANKQALRTALEAESASLKQQILDKVDKLWETGQYKKKIDIYGIDIIGNKGEEGTATPSKVKIRPIKTVKLPIKYKPSEAVIDKMIEKSLEKEIEEATEREKRKFAKQRADKAFATAMLDCETKMKGLEMDTTTTTTTTNNPTDVAEKKKQIKAEMMMMQNFVKKLNTDKQAEIDAGLTDDLSFLQVPEIPAWIIAMDKQNIIDKKEGSNNDDDDVKEKEEDSTISLADRQTPSELEQQYAKLIDYDNPFDILSQPNPDPQRVKALKYWLALQRQRAVQEVENNVMLKELAKTPLPFIAHCIRKTIEMNDGVDVEYRLDDIKRRVKGGMWVDMGLEERFGLEAMFWLDDRGIDLDEWVNVVEEASAKEGFTEVKRVRAVDEVD